MGRHMHDPVLSVELFVSDLPESVDFYGRVLGFKKGEQKTDGYAPMSLGAAQIALNLHSGLSADHPVHIAGNERPGRGVELVIKVSDIKATYNRIRSQGWPFSSELEPRYWGLTDFRIVDPDGYYWRFSSRE